MTVENRIASASPTPVGASRQPVERLDPRPDHRSAAHRRRVEPRLVGLLVSGADQRRALVDRMAILYDDMFSAQPDLRYLGSDPNSD